MKMDNEESMQLLSRGDGGQPCIAGITKLSIDLENCGPVSVFVQGDMDKLRDRPAIMTVHDVGSSYMTLVDLFGHPDLNNLRSRCNLIHIGLRGQVPDADNLPGEFPSIQDIGVGLINVLDHLHIPTVTLVGEGAGANICLRFAMYHPTRVMGLALINASAGVSSLNVSGSAIEDGLNASNVAKFLDAYKKRSSILAELKDRMKSDLICISGSKFKFAEDCEAIRSNTTIGLCSVIKVDDITNPVREAQDKFADVFILFCQGLGLFPTVGRKMSRQISNEGSGNGTPNRKLSMEQYDLPNLRRFSLTPGDKEIVNHNEILKALKDRMGNVNDDSSLQRHIIELENCGPISIYVQGDLERRSAGYPVFLTVHDVRSSYISMMELISHPDMDEIRSRSLFLHVSVFGQGPGAEDLAMDFPTLQNIGLGLVTVLDQLRISQVICIGDGAGANICLRFGLCHPTRTTGLFLINPTAREDSSMFSQIKRRMSMTTTPGAKYELINNSNVAKYQEAFNKRTDLVSQLAERINFDVMCVTGAKNRLAEESDVIHSSIKPGHCSVLKVEDTEEPLSDAVDKIADTLILFCQGVGLMPTAKRKISRSNQDTDSKDGRKMSMEMYDVPNVRRLSLTSQ